MLIFGLVLCLGGIASGIGLYAWAAWDWNGTSDRNVRDRAPVKYVPPRYLLMGGISAVVGLLLIAASQGS